MHALASLVVVEAARMCFCRHPHACGYQVYFFSRARATGQRESKRVTGSLDWSHEGTQVCVDAEAGGRGFDAFKSSSTAASSPSPSPSPPPPPPPLTPPRRAASCPSSKASTKCATSCTTSHAYQPNPSSCFSYQCTVSSSTDDSFRFSSSTCCSFCSTSASHSHHTATRASCTEHQHACPCVLN